MPRGRRASAHIVPMSPFGPEDPATPGRDGLRERDELDQFCRRPNHETCYRYPPHSLLTSAMPDLIGRSLGPYRILEMIGRGGMAAIYKAYQPATDRLVAIKVLLDARAEDAGVVQRFEHEARIIAGLEHRNIVPVYDFGRDGDLLYLVMRYMRAGTVNDLLRSGPLAANDASSILSDVAAALDYAHALAIVHRDIKPNNILVDAEGDRKSTRLNSSHQLISYAVFCL